MLLCRQYIGIGMFDESARASERSERAKSCLTRQQENKQKGKQEEKQGKGPKAQSLLRNNAPVVLVSGAPFPVLLKQRIECRLDGRSKPFPTHSRNFAIYDRARLAVLIDVLTVELGSFPLVLY